MIAIDYIALADYLNRAELEQREVTRLTEKYPELSVEDGYRIQQELVALKQAEGHRIVGPKMGLTSRAKMKQMNVEEPIYGYVFDYMVVPDGATISMRELIHPKAEAEIAFVIGKDIEGPGITGAQVLAATEYVVAALEIIDSRYENFKFTLSDVIADNASSSRIILGKKVTRPADLELDLLGVTLSINGEMKGLGAGAAVLGHPANSIAMLANMLARRGEKIKAGEIILSGAVTEAFLLNVGDKVSAKVQGLGEVSFTLGE
jgi:2-oxo-3-hexenedioate decarboxylase